MPEFTSLDIFNFFSKSTEKEDMYFKRSITYDFVTYHNSFKGLMSFLDLHMLWYFLVKYTALPKEGHGLSFCISKSKAGGQVGCWFKVNTGRFI